MTNGLLSNEAEQTLIESVLAIVKSSIQQEPEQYFNKKELVEYLNIVNNTFDAYLAARLPFVRIGSKRLYIKSEVDKFLKSNQETII